MLLPRKTSNNWVHCPVCDCSHHKQPRGEALRLHRIRLMLCEPKAIDEWRKVSSR